MNTNNLKALAQCRVVPEPMREGVSVPPTMLEAVLHVVQPRPGAVFRPRVRVFHVRRVPSRNLLASLS